MQAGAFQKAMRLYTKALEIDAGNAILYSNRSAAHFNVRQFAESLEDAESAILCDSMWWKAYKRKGLALIHMQRYEEAIQALEEGLKIVGKNAEMEKNLEFARACQEQAQNLYILPEPHMMQRLESVPVFIVTDNLGQPFFVTYDDGQQVCTFYFDQEDAKATLDWIKSENPDLGDTARVINITLNQAFNLAQETQKQYYEETTRAAAEEDRLAAAAAQDGEQKGKELAQIGDNSVGAEKDVDDWEDDASDTEGADDGKEADDTSATEDSAKEDTAKEDTVKEDSAKEDTVKEDTVKEDTVKEDAISKPKEETSAEAGEKETVGSEEAKEEKTKEEETKEEDGNKNDEDPVIDENAPLSFQFRPELRQVKVAVELLNKHPNPPVRPILRDPPALRKAKAEAAAKAKAEGDASTEEGISEKSEGAAEATETASATNESEKPSTNSEDKSSGVESADKGDNGDDEDVELTVDNFNGIPIFQAKGLTLLQKNKQLIPLFFSKWDLEAAWKQLKESNTLDIPGECEIDVGTLEDVLRRMSESKTDEFESVFFVPSRESMKAINVKFPLDELSPPVARSALGGGRGVKKAGFSKARQIKARGGTDDEIRAAIREDLEKHVERQRMAEIIAQIEQARRTGGVSGVGGVGLGATGGGPGGNTKNGIKA